MHSNANVMQQSEKEEKFLHAVEIIRQAGQVSVANIPLNQIELQGV